MPGQSKIASVLPMTDEQTMWQVHMFDDCEAYARLVREWERPIQRLCVRMLGDVHRAKDLAQETFIRVFARRKDYQPTGRFSTFLWRIAVNLCYDELRKIRRRREATLKSDEGDGPDETVLFVDSAANPAIQLEAGDQARIVQEALQKLDEPYRTIVILRHYENLKFREIAEVLEIPDGTVKSRMAEALTRLNRILYPIIKEENLWTTKSIKTSECLV